MEHAKPESGRKFEWYDSLWLGSYFAAQDILRREAPARLKDFEDAMQVFRCPQDYRAQIARAMFEGDWLEQLRAIIRSIPRERYEVHELSRFGRFVVFGLPEFNAMQERLVDVVSQMCGEQVEPFYNFLSLYTHKGVCEPHLDAPFAKWTLDVCIDQSEPWPIHVSRIVDWPGSDLDFGPDWRDEIRGDPALEFRPLTLMPGDALLFSGPNQWHYRDAYATVGGKPHCDLLFFHFIPAGTSELVDPENWARLFGVPELAVLRRGRQQPILIPR